MMPIVSYIIGNTASKCFTLVLQNTLYTSGLILQTDDEVLYLELSISKLLPDLTLTTTEPGTVKVTLTGNRWRGEYNADEAIYNATVCHSLRRVRVKESFAWQVASIPITKKR